MEGSRVSLIAGLVVQPDFCLPFLAALRLPGPHVFLGKTPSCMGVRRVHIPLAPSQGLNAPSAERGGRNHWKPLAEGRRDETQEGAPEHRAGRITPGSDGI